MMRLQLLGDPNLMRELQAVCLSRPHFRPVLHLIASIPIDTT
jgi:hypothetical protein